MLSFEAPQYSAVVLLLSYLLGAIALESIASRNYILKKVNTFYSSVVCDEEFMNPCIFSSSDEDDNMSNINFNPDLI